MPLFAWPLLADAVVCWMALGLGATIEMAQWAGMLVVAIGGVAAWRRLAAGVSLPWRASCLLGLAVLLAGLMRSPLLHLAIDHWGWPAPVAVLLAVLLGGAVMRWGLSASSRGGWLGFAAGLTLYAGVLRLLYGGLVELLPEETYYWNYSQHLDIGYLDHPPMVAWLIHAGTWLFGNTEWGVRSGAVCCGFVTGCFLYRLTRNIGGSRPALFALAISQALPFFFAAGMVMTPDAPLTAAWAASLYFLERALIGGRARAWLGFGIAFGAGLLSKYTIALLGGGAFVFMLWDPEARRWFHRWQPYAAVLVAAAVFGPVILWNAEHDWASFAFQTARRLAEQPRFSLHRLLAAALILITPIGFWAAVAALRAHPHSAAGAAAQGAPRAWRLLTLVSLLPLAVFAVFSLRHEVKLDWTGAPWTATVPLMALALTGRRAGLAGEHAGPAWGALRTAWPVTLGLLMSFYAAGFYHLTRGIPGLGYSSHTELLPLGWRDFGRQIDAIAAGTAGDAVLVVGMDRYAIASERAFYSANQASAVANTCSWHLFDDLGLMYERWFPREREVGRTLVLVAFDAANLAPEHLARHVARLDSLQEAWITRDGTPVRRYYYRVAHGYH